MDIVDQAFLNAKQVKLKKLKHTIKFQFPLFTVHHAVM